MNADSIDFTQRVAEHVSSCTVVEAGHPLYDHARIALKDYIAVSIAAVNEPLVHALISQANMLGGNPQASLTGAPGKFNVSQAALINGSMAHALDYDDTLSLYMGHPTVTLYPALLALAEWRGLEPRAVLDAYLVGLHAGCWIARAIGPGHYSKGWHGTSTIGRQGAAAACARLLGLDASQTVQALGIAGTQAAGVKQSFGTMCKPYHAGTASQGGLLAALLAETGFTAAEDVYEGELGLVKLLGTGDGEYSGPEVSDTGHPVEYLAHKFHAACHCTHAPIDIIMAVAEERAITEDDIESIDVRCSQISLDNANKTDPKTGLDGKFSINYSMANALIRGITGMAGYTDEMVRSPEIQGLMQRITVQVDDEHREAGLKTTCNIKLLSGETVRRSLDPLHDLPGMEEKRDKIRAKMLDLTAPPLGKERAAALDAAIDDFERCSSVAGFMDMAQIADIDASPRYSAAS